MALKMRTVPKRPSMARREQLDRIIQLVYRQYSLSIGSGLLVTVSLCMKREESEIECIFCFGGQSIKTLILGLETRRVNQQ